MMDVIKENPIKNSTMENKEIKQPLKRDCAKKNLNCNEMKILSRITKTIIRERVRSKNITKSIIQINRLYVDK